MLAAGAAAEVLPADDHGVLAGELPLGHEARRTRRKPLLAFGHAAVGVHTEVFAFLGDRGIKGKVLRGDDLIRVDVVAQDVRLAGDDALHDFL